MTASAAMRLASALAIALAATPAFAQSETKQESVKALMQQARAHAAGGNAAGALDALRRARALAPNSEDVLSAIAQVSLAARAPLRAMEVLEPLTRICATVAQYHYLYGVALMQAGDLVASVEALQQAERLEPDRELTLVALGLALNGRKLYADAEPYLRRALELRPGDIDAMAALAEALEGLDRLPEAETLARRVLASADTHATANLVAGLILMKQERYAEARDALLKAAASDPSSSRAHYQLSLAYARLGDEISSARHRELYQQKLRELDARTAEIRKRTGS